jgi:4-amino-4-deoxy-L-arabinose transferase-like glycosyltransferase
MMNKIFPAKHRDLALILSFFVGLVILFHVGTALRGHGQFRDLHLGTALHYAQTKIDLADTIIVGFNATGTPTIQELPVWQMAAGLAFKLLGPWWGWANIVALGLFLPCLFPLFQIARMCLDERRAWWVLIFFLAEPLVFINAGAAATDGFCLAAAIWFLYCGVKLVREPGLKWLALACALGSLTAVSKLPFFMAAGLALFFLTLWQSGFDIKRLGFLAVAGGVSGMVFLLWTHYTDSLQANAVFPFVDLRLKGTTNGSTMMFWYFGDWHYRLSAGNWIKGGWRCLTALLGSFLLAGLVALALADKKGNPVARCLLAGALLTTLVFTHLVLHHWHYYLMFAPAVALLCAEGLAVLEMRFAPQSSKPAFGIFVAGLLGLSLLQGLMGMRSLTYDPYPAEMAGNHPG